MIVYFGDRKTGCRFYEFVFKGYRSLYIENNRIRTVLLLDKGTDIISFVDKKTDIEFVWTNPMGLSCLDKMRISKMDNDCYSDNYLGGWFEILPNVGDECIAEGKHYTTHGETSFLPWDYTVIKDSEQEMQLLFITRLSKIPIEIQKLMILKADEATIYFKEEIINVGKTTVPYLWGFHPNIGKPFLNENCVFNLPFSDEKYSMPEPGNGDSRIYFFENVDVPYASVFDTKKNIGVEIKWDNSSMKNFWLWICAGHDTGHHHHNGAYVCCMLPTSAKNSRGLSALGKIGQVLYLDASEVHKNAFSIGVTRHNL